jgi:cytoskeletal protein CcmA (bactofilin family)
MADNQGSPAGRSLPVRHQAEIPLTVISEGDVVIGRLDIAGNGNIFGSFEGELSCGGDLVIGSEATVRTASIQAHHVTISGVVKADVIARGRLKITSTGKLQGDARVGSLVVQEGGVHYGLLEVYPDGVPAEIPEHEAALVRVPPPRPPRSRGLSMERVKKMWGELF